MPARPSPVIPCLILFLLLQLPYFPAIAECWFPGVVACGSADEEASNEEAPKPEFDRLRDEAWLNKKLATLCPKNGCKECDQAGSACRAVLQNSLLHRLWSQTSAGNCKQPDEAVWTWNCTSLGAKSVAEVSHNFSFGKEYQAAKEACNNGGICVAQCGDAWITPPEACDQGTQNGSAGHCNSTCTGQTPQEAGKFPEQGSPTIACGDAKLDPAEECEDIGNEDKAGGCGFECKLEAPAPEKVIVKHYHVQKAAESYCLIQLKDKGVEDVSTKECSEALGDCKAKVIFRSLDTLKQKCNHLRVWETAVLTKPSLATPKRRSALR